VNAHRKRRPKVVFGISTLLLFTLLCAVVFALSRNAVPRFAIRPGQAIGPVKLGMTRADVRQVLAQYSDATLDQASREQTDFAFGNTLHVGYSSDGEASFIGASWHVDCGCDYTLNGRHIRDFTAPEMFAELAIMDGGTRHSYDPDEYFFPRIGVTVWQADSQYDDFGGEKRPVYAEVGVREIENAASQ